MEKIYLTEGEERQKHIKHFILTLDIDNNSIVFQPRE